jgi:hypothetical protein
LNTQPPPRYDVREDQDMWQRASTAGMIATFRVAIVMAASLAAVSLCGTGRAWSSDETDKAAPQLPNIYLDLATTLATIPANTLGFGFGGAPPVSLLPTGTLPAARAIGINAPLTFDINDRISVYGGVHAYSAGTDISPWTPLVVDSLQLGFQADIYQQNGGSFPTVTLQSTLYRSVLNTPLATTTSDTYAQFSYAFDEDETRGVLAGVRYDRIIVDSPLAVVSPYIVGYAGGYYQWPNNWKLTGYAGMQTFNGAHLLNLISLPAFTQPIVRADLDRLDDNGNRLFGVTGEIAWTPAPSFQLILRTPIFAVRH